MLYSLDFAYKYKVFGPIVLTPEVVRPVGYKWALCENTMRKTRL